MSAHMCMSVNALKSVESVRSLNDERVCECESGGERSWGAV